MIPYGRQDVTQEDVDIVSEVLRSPFLTQGPAVGQFEEALCGVTTADFAVAVNSATSALHIAYLALELGSGDVLWTSPNTFVATSNAALYCGATVDFVDIDPRTYVMCATALQTKLEQAKLEGRLPKIVSVVQFAGQSADMVAIAKLAKEFGFSVVEDASHSIGAQYDGAPVGNCAHSDICVFSFHPVKIITTAEGGAATTNNPDLAKRMQLFRSHGVTREVEQMYEKNPDPWYYEQVELGWNYRITDIQAALGVSQIKRLSKYIDRRHEIFSWYRDGLQGLDLILPEQALNQRSALHLYPVQVLGKCRLDVFKDLRSNGLGVNVHYIPVHTQPYYTGLGFKYGDFPEAERYYERAISLPMFPTMTEQDFDHVVLSLKNALT